MYAKDLDALPPTDARNLLLKISPRIDRHTSSLAQLCGYLPLALQADIDEAAWSALYSTKIYPRLYRFTG